MKGFTLVEFLLGAAIIAVIVSIILPTTNKVENPYKSGDAVCHTVFSQTLVVNGDQIISGSIYTLFPTGETEYVHLKHLTKGVCK